ncbi:MAG: nucleotidyltransferase domain-containing protein [bacterium]|nr:nucleotidyltransferase domain-containing protein [bacterium]
MTVVAPTGTPTRDDAVVAGAALIAAGAEEVLLVGSVARDEARPYSDIDLVAIFADLDYAQRHARRLELEAAAGEVVPWSVQVHVTDRPEWRARVKRVPASFESRVAGGAVVIATASERGLVDWDKEMVLPMSDAQEALRQFDHWVLPRLEDLALSTLRAPKEADPRRDVATRERHRLERMVRICTHAALTVETSLKTLAVLLKTPTPTEKELRDARHNIRKCLKLVPAPAVAEVSAVFDGLSVDLTTLSQWRARGTYPTDITVEGEIADRLAPTYAAMAPIVAEVLATRLQQELPSGPVLDDAVARCRELGEEITARDVRLGVAADTGLNL